MVMQFVSTPASTKIGFVAAAFSLGMIFSSVTWTAAHADPVADVKSNVTIVLNETKALEGLQKQAVALLKKIEASGKKRGEAMTKIDATMDQIVSMDEKTEKELDTLLENMGKALETEATVHTQFIEAAELAQTASDH